ncbi:MAG TPA: hypothetical protein VF117_09400 [Gammaproteobacteria bacterium]
MHTASPFFVIKVIITLSIIGFGLFYYLLITSKINKFVKMAKEDNGAHAESDLKNVDILRTVRQKLVFALIPFLVLMFLLLLAGK